MQSHRDGGWPYFIQKMISTHSHQVIYRFFSITYFAINQLNNFLEEQASFHHYGDVIMSVISPQITVVSILCTVVCSGADQRKHQSSASMDFVRGIHRSPVNSPHKGPVTWKMFPFDDVTMRDLSLSKMSFGGISCVAIIPVDGVDINHDLDHRVVLGDLKCDWHIEAEAKISQTTFFNAFYWMKIYEFR